MNHQESIEFAKEYLENIIAFFGVNVTVTAHADEDVIELDVDSSELNSLLIGRNAETLRSLQYMTSTALRNQNAALYRVNVDIASYKQQRAEQIAEKARGWIEEVRRTGDSHIARLNAADRRVVHRVAGEYEDIHTFSEGEGRERHLIIAQRSS